MIAAEGAQGATGGMLSSFPPKVEAVECLTRCAGIDVVRPGGKVRLSGSELATATAVTFRGGKDPADDVTANVATKRESSVTVAVPAAARTGPVVVKNADGLPSDGKATVAIDRGESSSAAARIEARVSSRTVFFAGKRKARLSYVVQGSAPAKVSIGLVHQASGRLIRTWAPGMVAPGTARSVVWDGRGAGNAIAPEGRYRFRIVTGSDASGGAKAAADPGDAFTFLRHIFPIRGPHGFGTFTNRFGGGRSHGGQDVLANCGIALVAARGGKVTLAGYSSGGGGNAVVIDGAGTSTIYVYYHMRDAPLVKVGDTVWTGQLLGFVGSTGSSTACHLHFEMHNGGSWYDDSRAFDPLPHLLAWDRRT